MSGVRGIRGLTGQHSAAPPAAAPRKNGLHNSTALLCSKTKQRNLNKRVNVYLELVSRWVPSPSGRVEELLDGGLLLRAELRDALGPQSSRSLQENTNTGTDSGRGPTGGVVTHMGTRNDQQLDEHQEKQEICRFLKAPFTHWHASFPSFLH